jgi:hypothetical protein
MSDDHKRQQKLRKLKAINDELARHKRMARHVLFLLVLVNTVLLALVVNHLWGHPWTPKSLQNLIP